MAARVTTLMHSSEPLVIERHRMNTVKYVSEQIIENRALDDLQHGWMIRDRVASFHARYTTNITTTGQDAIDVRRGEHGSFQSAFIVQMLEVFEN